MIMRCKIQCIVLILALGFFSVSEAQSKSEKKERKQIDKQEAFNEIKDLVLSKKFEFIADQALPTGFRNVNLIGNPNYLRVRNDTVMADMPYFGRAYQSTPGERGGIYFEVLPEDYKVDINEKKRTISITFTAREDSKTYRCNLQVGGKEAASLSVIADHLSSISYWGDLSELPKAKK